MNKITCDIIEKLVANPGYAITMDSLSEKYAVSKRMIYNYCEEIEDFLTDNGFKELILTITHFLHWYCRHESLSTTIEYRYLFTYRHRRILWLNEQLIILTTPIKRHSCDSIHIRREL